MLSPQRHKFPENIYDFLIRALDIFLIDLYIAAAEVKMFKKKPPGGGLKFVQTDALAGLCSEFFLGRRTRARSTISAMIYSAQVKYSTFW